MSRAWKSEFINSKPTVLRFDFPDVSSGFEQWIFLSSDRHHDNQFCNHQLEKRDLDLARERNALVFDFGDLFCAMQGKWDRRKDQDELRDELRGNQYLDKLVSYNADFYAPYADLFGLVSRGNHETSVLKNHETDLLDRMSERIAATNGERIPVGGYNGWIQLRFHRGNQIISKIIRYTHGYGGGGPVTKDVIQTNRLAAHIDFADIVVSGHTHDQWVVPQQRTRLTRYGKQVQRKMWFVKCGGYKDEFDRGEGWVAETGKPPKPLGGVWVRMRLINSRVESQFIIED